MTPRYANATPEVRRPRSWLVRLQERADTEHEQALLRLVIGSAACLYMVGAELFGDAGWTVGPAIVVVAVGFMASALALLLGILIWPSPSPFRRIAGILLDLSATTVAMSLAGEHGAPLLAVYLWVIIGNGFRFGVSYLVVAACLAVVGFIVVIALSPFWHSHPFLGISYLLVLILIPPYVALLLRKLTEAVDRANDANRAKSQFLAKMSHELRTPLNGVIGGSELLMDGELGSEQRSLARTIKTSAQTLLGIIENILDLSRIEAGRVQLERIDFDLHRLLADTLEVVRPQARRKGLALSMRIDPQLPFLLRGDPLHLRQILINLLGNAVKFTETGSVVLRAGLAGGMETGGRVLARLEVEDTGIGIAETDQATIFDRFRQADSSITRRYGGSGLGTAIARELARLMGGEIGLRSMPGRGSLFWVEVPLEVRESVLPSPPEPGFGGLRLLVIGAGDLTRALSGYLIAWGLEHRIVRSPIEACAELNTACSRDRSYHLVLVCTGANLPDPARIATELRLTAGCDAVGLVLVGALRVDGDMEHWHAQGYSSVVHDPLDKRLLFNAIHAASSAREIPGNVVSLIDHYRAKAAPTSAHLRILVAEDNETNRLLLRGLLERVGHSVTLFDNGDAALEALANGADDFDLMVIDHNMPGRSGLDVFKAHRFMRAGAALPTIILTADATPEARQACLDAGVTAFLTKPIESVKLLELIAAVGAAGCGRQDPGHHASGVAAPGLLLDDDKLRALDQLAADPAFVHELVQCFRRDGESAIERLGAALDEQDYPALRATIHALRGVAAEFGALRVLDLCRQLQTLRPFELHSERAASLLAALRLAQGETISRLAVLYHGPGDSNQPPGLALPPEAS